MQFREALAKICTEPIAENGAFLTYAKLSDLCGNDYESVRKISLFYQIDRKLLVAHHIQTEGKAAVPVLLAAYPAVKDLHGLCFFLSYLRNPFVRNYIRLFPSSLLV